MHRRQRRFRVRDELVVAADVHRQSGLTAHLGCFAELPRPPQVLVASVGRVDAAVRSRNSGERGELARVRMGRRLIVEAGIEPDSARAHPRFGRGSHRVQLGVCGDPRVPAHDADANRQMRRLRDDVHGRPALERAQVGFRRGPVERQVRHRPVGESQDHLDLAGRGRRDATEPEAVGAGEVRRDTLEKAAGRIGRRGQDRQLRVDVDIDEARRDDAASRVDSGMRRPGGRPKVADCDDPVAGDPDIRPPPRSAGPIDDVAAGDDQIEWRDRLHGAQSARPGRSPVAAPSMTTQRPLTMTRLMPAGRAAGSPPSVARLAMVEGSKIVRSAASPSARTPRYVMPTRSAGTCVIW